MIQSIAFMRIIAVATLAAMFGGTSAFIYESSSRKFFTGGLTIQSLASSCTRCVAKGGRKPAQSSPNSRGRRHLEPSPILFARRRRGGSSSADEADGDDYDDDYIDELINEKFDDFDDDDDDIVIDAEVEEDGDDDREYEYARVGGRRGRGADRYEEDVGGGGRSTAEDSAGDGSSRREQRRRRQSYEDDDDGIDQYDGYDAEFDEEDDYYEEDYEEDYGSEFDDDDDDDFEEGILIPNPILDSIDPEGASERIGELFVDSKFWKDALAIAFVTWIVYYITFDPTDLFPWDSVKVDDFDLQALYEKR